jgi:hypothetical protein
MRVLLHFLSLSYYVLIILFIICSATAIISYRNRYKFRVLRLLPWYVVGSALQLMGTFICVYYLSPLSIQINNYSIFLYVIAELIVFYNLVLQLVNNFILRKSMYLILMGFIIFSIYAVATLDFATYIPLSFYMIDSICLIIPSTFYFYEVFTTTPLLKLSNQPSFWVIIGFSFMAICTLPFCLLEGYLLKNMSNIYNQLCTLNYAFYCLLFLFISKAFLCKHPTT